MDRSERGSTLARPLLIDEQVEEAVLRALAGRKLVAREERFGIKEAARWLREHGWEKDAIIQGLAELDCLLRFAIRGDGWRLLSHAFGPEGSPQGTYVLLIPAEEDICSR